MLGINVAKIDIQLVVKGRLILRADFEVKL